MSKLMKLIIMAVVGLVVLVSAIAAEQADTKKPAPDKAGTGEPKYTEIKYSADISSYRWDGEDRILVLNGNVRFEQGDTILLADKVDYRESTKTANATGNLKIYDDRNTITGDLCAVNFKEKKGSLTGSVRMVAKPKPQDSSGSKPKGDSEDSKPKSLRSEWKDEAVITCDKIDYYYKEKKAVVPSPLTMVQKSRVVTADSATYLGKEEIVQLAGNVKGRDEKDKHTFAAPKVTMSLKEDDEWIEAEKATGSFYVKEEEEESKPVEKAPEKPGP